MDTGRAKRTPPPENTNTRALFRCTDTLTTHTHTHTRCVVAVAFAILLLLLLATFSYWAYLWHTLSDNRTLIAHSTGNKTRNSTGCTLLYVISFYLLFSYSFLFCFFFFVHDCGKKQRKCFIDRGVKIFDRFCVCAHRVATVVAAAGALLSMPCERRQPCRKNLIFSSNCL